MTIRYLYIILFSFIFQLSFSQHSFSESELQDFVKVYMSFKKEKKRNTHIDKKYFDIHNVSEKRYREIAKAALTNDKITLNQNEEQLKLALIEQNKIEDKSNKNLIEQLCLQNELSTDLYFSILHKYKSDIQFQRSLKPHFQTYIKLLK